jgi:hypothetical protein
MADEQQTAEISAQIDAQGNLVVKNLDRASLERLRGKLDEVSKAVAAGTAEAAGPVLRVEAIVR